jgi:hypothetical protein
MPTSRRRGYIWSTSRVERRGYGNEANEEVEVLFVELMWWKEEMRFSRRVLVTLEIYLSLFAFAADLAVVVR